MTTDDDRIRHIEDVVVRLEERQRAHENVHKLEEISREKALSTLSKELDELNNVRVRFIPREVFDTRMGAVERFQARLIGIGAILVIVAGFVGRLIK